MHDTIWGFVFMKESNRLDTVHFKTSVSLTKQVEFVSTIDCENEVLIADLYVMEATTKTSTISNGSDVGSPIGQKMVLNLDVTGIALGSYALKIFTAETGVVAKAICIIR